MPAGVLVGPVLGGFVGGIGFAAACLWFFKRGEKIKSKYQPMPEEEGLAMGAIPSPMGSKRRPLSSLGPDRSSLYSADSSHRAVPPMMGSAAVEVQDNAIYEVSNNARNELGISSAYPK
jgi:hypothetical protein